MAQQASHLASQIGDVLDAQARWERCLALQAFGPTSPHLSPRKASKGLVEMADENKLRFAEKKALFDVCRCDRFF